MRAVKVKDVRARKSASRASEWRIERGKGTNPDGGSHTRGKPRFVLYRPMLALTFALVVLGGVAGLFAGGYVARAIAGAETTIAVPFTEAGFAVSAIALTGQEHTPADAAYKALAITEGGSIFGVRPDAARARLLMLPWVADAEVRRHFPDTVSVRLIEKRPFALWRNGNELSIIERSGAVIVKTDGDRFGRLPVIAGAGAPQAAAPIIDALEGQKAIMARLEAIQRIGERRWDLLLSGGVTARLPEDGWERQISELERLIVEKGVLERDIEMIDLRYPDNYVFRLHNGDSRPVPRERRA